MPTSDTLNASATLLTQGLDAISRKLVAARLNAQALHHFPGDLPDNLEDAYAVQSASIGRWPDDIVGWKVGMVPAEYRQSLAAERLAGPIYRSSVFDISTGDTKSMPIYSGGFAAVEAEFVLRLATTIAPVEKSWSDAELTDLVAALHVGAEIASSPMADINRLGPCCVVSDFGNNAGLLVGPSVADWSGRDPETLTAAVHVDGELVGTATANAIQGGLLQALRFLVELSATRGLTLTEGTYVSCGALTGIHDVTSASHAVVDFGEFGAFNVDFEPMVPLQERNATVHG
ncbi:MAG: 2-keto-4-pentenoate hydratase [Pseudomonadota bacterium]